jgi:hypothetical protein
MLVKFTIFNPLDPMDSDHFAEIDSKGITSVVGSETGDSHTYTTITAAMGARFFVKETVDEVMDLIAET